MKASELAKLSSEKVPLDWELMRLGETPTPGDAGIDGIQHPAGLPTQLLNEGLHRPEDYSYRHWGINE